MVRLLYTYRDGHTFETEAMLESVALAYMPMLRAEQVEPGLWRANFGEIRFVQE